MSFLHWLYDSQLHGLSSGIHPPHGQVRIAGLLLHYNLRKYEYNG